jgi:hypothetical protein
VNLKVYIYTLGQEVVAVIVQADEGTMLKVNLPVEFKGDDMVALGRRKVPFCAFCFFDNIYMVCQSINVLLRY